MLYRFLVFFYSVEFSYVLFIKLYLLIIVYCIYCLVYISMMRLVVIVVRRFFISIFVIRIECFRILLYFITYAEYVYVVNFVS